MVAIDVETLEQQIVESGTALVDNLPNICQAVIEILDSDISKASFVWSNLRPIIEEHQR